MKMTRLRMLVIAAIVGALLLRPNITATIEEINLRATGPVVYPTPEKILTRLATETAPSNPAMVLADQNLSVSIPAFVGNADIVAHRLLTTSEIFPADEQDQENEEKTRSTGSPLGPDPRPGHHRLLQVRGQRPEEECKPGPRLRERAGGAGVALRDG